jgi:hypothetical protein
MAAALQEIENGMGLRQACRTYNVHVHIETLRRMVTGEIGRTATLALVPYSQRKNIWLIGSW